MKFTLDKPTALNNLYGVNRFGTRYLKKEGMAWKTNAQWEIKSFRPTLLTDPVSMRVDLYTCRHQDNDSILKLLQDTLQGIVIDDDYQIFDLRVVKHVCIQKDEKIEVEILPLDNCIQ